MASRVAIIGISRLAEELLLLCRDNGLPAELHAAPSKVPASTELIVETCAGVAEEKKQLIQTLDGILSPSSVILTSSLRFSPTQIASWTKNPERIVGFATFYPVKERKMIELSWGLKTAEKSAQAAEEFFKRLGKETIQVREGAGLIFPRILSLIINEAARSLSEGVAEAEEIDVAMRLGVNYPTGPLQWADQVGLDEVLAVLEGLHDETGDDRYRPAPLLKRMVQAGWLGEQTGRGFRVRSTEL